MDVNSLEDLVDITDISHFEYERLNYLLKLSRGEEAQHKFKQLFVNEKKCREFYDEMLAFCTRGWLVSLARLTWVLRGISLRARGYILEDLHKFWAMSGHKEYDSNVFLKDIAWLSHLEELLLSLLDSRFFNHHFDIIRESFINYFGEHETVKSTFMPLDTQRLGFELRQLLFSRKDNNSINVKFKSLFLPLQNKQSKQKTQECFFYESFARLSPATVVSAGLVALHLHAPHFSTSMGLFNSYYSFTMKYVGKRKLHDFGDLAGISEARFQTGKRGGRANPFYRNPTQELADKAAEKAAEQAAAGQEDQDPPTPFYTEENPFVVEPEKQAFSDGVIQWLAAIDGDDTGLSTFNSLETTLQENQLMNATYEPHNSVKETGATKVFSDLERDVGVCDYWVFNRQLFGELFIIKKDEFDYFYNVNVQFMKDRFIKEGENVSYVLDGSNYNLKVCESEVKNVNTSLRGYTEKVCEFIRDYHGMTYKHLLENNLPFFKEKTSKSLSNSNPNSPEIKNQKKKKNKTARIRKKTTILFGLRLVLLYTVHRQISWTHKTIHSLTSNLPILTSNGQAFGEFMSLFGKRWFAVYRNILLGWGEQSRGSRDWMKMIRMLVKCIHSLPCASHVHGTHL